MIPNQTDLILQAKLCEYSEHKYLEYMKRLDLYMQWKDEYPGPLKAERKCERGSGRNMNQAYPHPTWHKQIIMLIFIA